MISNNNQKNYCQLLSPPWVVAQKKKEEESYIKNSLQLFIKTKKIYWAVEILQCLVFKK